jgi:hypothetical protein
LTTKLVIQFQNLIFLIGQKLSKCPPEYFCNVSFGESENSIVKTFQSLHPRLKEFQLYVIKSAYLGGLVDASITHESMLIANTLRSIYKGTGQFCIIARVPHVSQKVLFTVKYIRHCCN